MSLLEAARILEQYHSGEHFFEIWVLVEAEKIARENGCLGEDSNDYNQWAKEIIKKA